MPFSQVLYDYDVSWTVRMYAVLYLWAALKPCCSFYGHWENLWNVEIFTSTVFAICRCTDVWLGGQHGYNREKRRREVSDRHATSAGTGRCVDRCRITWLSEISYFVERRRAVFAVACQRFVVISHALLTWHRSLASTCAGPGGCKIWPVRLQGVIWRVKHGFSFVAFSCISVSVIFCITVVFRFLCCNLFAVWFGLNWSFAPIN